MKNEDKDLYKFIKETIANIAEIPTANVKDDSNFQNDLDMDSLEAVEILHKIEKKYRVKLSNIELDEVQSLKDIYEKCRDVINNSK